MNRLFQLDGRLAVCADFVRDGAKLADIGTDHAYLPVWLAKNGRIPSAIAADVRPSPLERGAENIRKYCAQDRVSTRLSNGLLEIAPDEADDIVIAGMGAELIADIIGNAPWLKSKDKHLILQPMTKANVLRKYLSENGFAISEEKACAHGGKLYSVMSVYYTGECRKIQDCEEYIGKLDMTDGLSRDYARNILRKLMHKRDGIEHEGKETAPIDNMINEIKARCGND